MHRGGITSRAALAALLGVAAASCSADDCRSLKSKIGPLAFTCGAQGDDPPPEQRAPKCPSLDELAPALLKLARDPARPLLALSDTLAALDEPRCLLPQRSCTSSAQCSGAPCEAGQCACPRTYRPLGELLRSVLGLFQALAREPAEPGAAPGRCVSIDAAAALRPEQRTRGCELRRLVDVALDGGGRALLADPRLLRTSAALSRYLSGATTGTAHPEVPAALGRLSRTPLCASEDFTAIGEKLLASLTPALVAEIAGSVRAIASDPDMKPFVQALTAGDSAPGRASVVFLVHYFFGQARAVRTGSEAARALDDIAEKFVYPSVPTARLKSELQAVFSLLRRALADEGGAFPPLQRLIACADDPAIDGGALVGAGFDLLSREEARGGLDALTLVGLFEAAMALDQKGQLTRSLRELMLWAHEDGAAASAVRNVVATAMCGAPEPDGPCDGTPAASGLFPAVDRMVGSGALADVLPLLDVLLHGCAKAAP